jgi:hypothetical protein
LAQTGLFRDAGARQPSDGVTPYALNAPLFSDGAAKHRYVALPPGASARYDSEEVFDFPVGTVLVKTFAFPHDMRAPAGGERLLETRLLVRRANGWTAPIATAPAAAPTRAASTSAGARPIPPATAWKSAPSPPGADQPISISP